MTEKIFFPIRDLTCSCISIKSITFIRCYAMCFVSKMVGWSVGSYAFVLGAYGLASCTIITILSFCCRTKQKFVHPLNCIKTSTNITVEHSHFDRSACAPSHFTYKCVYVLDWVFLRWWTIKVRREKDGNRVEFDQLLDRKKIKGAALGIVRPTNVLLIVNQTAIDYWIKHRA